MLEGRQHSSTSHVELVFPVKSSKDGDHMSSTLDGRPSLSGAVRCGKSGRSRVGATVSRICRVARIAEIWEEEKQWWDNSRKMKKRRRRKIRRKGKAKNPRMFEF